MHLKPMKPALVLLLLLAATTIPSGLPGQQEAFPAEPGVRELSGRMIVRPLQTEDWLLRGFSGDMATARHLRATQRIAGMLVRHYPEVDEHIIEVPFGWTEETLAAELLSSGDYAYAEPDWICYPVKTPNDPRYNQQWQHPKINAPAGWDIHTGNASQIAAFVDTGVDTNHPDLQNALTSGYNSADQKTQAQGGRVEDINGHGTFVAGCIGAIGDNGTGVAGVGWGLTLMPVRCTNSSSGGAYMSDITGGARWAADNGAKTISASYSGVDSGSVNSAGNYIKGKDALLFWASGNDGRNLGNWDWTNVLVVGATNQSDNRTSWSNYGRGLDLVAPGDGVYSTTNGGGYGSGSGTSFSTPIANGAAAVIWSNDPSLTADEVEMDLLNGCDDLGTAGEDDYYGYGRVNLEAGLLGGGGGGSDLILDLPTLTGGQFATVMVTRASSSALIHFFYSVVGTGTTTWGPLGVDLGILAPRSAGSAWANPQGDAALFTLVPAAGSGRTVWVQAAETGRISQVEQTLIQ